MAEEQDKQTFSRFGNEFQEKLSMLAAAYAKGLPEKIDEIEAMWNQLLASWSLQTMRDLHRVVHNLAGNGKIFGFPELSAEAHTLEQMLKQFIKLVHESKLLKPSPRIIICVPCGSTQVERRAIRESALGAGASQVFLIEEPMAAAIGAGLPVSEAAGSMVVDIGGGTTEVGVMSLGGVVYKGSVRVGGDKFDEAITNYIRRNYGMLIGEQTAEAVKKAIGSAFPGTEVKELEIKGRNISEGIPRSFTVTSNEILEALTDPLNQIVTAVKAALEQTPPELAADIAERGIMLTGGGALLRDLDRLLMEETGLPIHVAEDPLTCVARGCGIALERMDKLGGVFSQE